jgi:hypothetical protein
MKVERLNNIYKRNLTLIFEEIEIFFFNNLE